jgi:hypothetical protein
MHFKPLQSRSKSPEGIFMSDEEDREGVDTTDGMIDME